MKNVDKVYLYELYVKLLFLFLPIIILVLLINHNNITRVYLNYEYPHQLPNLHNDINYFINKKDYIDFRKVMREDFNKMIILDLNEDSAIDSISKYIKDNDFEIEFLEENKSRIRRKEAELGDYQLFLFFKDDVLIRYQEMSKTENYFFDIHKEKMYLKTYKFKEKHRILEPIWYYIINI